MKEVRSRFQSWPFSADESRGKEVNRGWRGGGTGGSGGEQYWRGGERQQGALDLGEAKTRLLLLPGNSCEPRETPPLPGSQFPAKQG